MQIGDLVTLRKEWVEEVWIGLVTKVWGRSSAGHHSNNIMCQVEWNKDMGFGLHFQDELEMLCE